MNNKNSNAWILCPSKSYPGKLYYFNVITGEAAWCLTEEEKKELAKVSIKKVSDKSHSFPEPNTPPTEDGPDTSNICYNLNPQKSLPTGCHMGPHQIFGQPVFSKYIPNQYMPSYVIPIPQMYLANNPEPKKRSFDQITQTSDVQVPCIQGYTIPLSKRFGSYRQFNSGNKTFKDKVSTQIKGDILPSNKGSWCNTDSSGFNFNTFNNSVFGSKPNSDKIKVRTSEHNPFYSNVNISNKQKDTRIIMNPILTSINRKENTNVHNFLINTGNKATDAIKKPTLILVTETKLKNNQVPEDSDMHNDIEPSFIKPAHNSQHSTVIKHSWMQNTLFEKNLKQPIEKLSNSDAMVSSLNKMNEIEDNIDNTLEYLNSNDLRFVLQAKRRKLKLGDVDKQVKTKDIFASKIYLNNELKKVNEKAKQVRFDLGLREKEKEVETQTSEKCEVHTPDSENVTETNSPTPQVINTSYLKSLAKPFKKTDPWYVVVDIGVLLNDFEFIEDFVTKDTTCRLLVPNSVRSYIETMSVGEYGGRDWVMLARKAMRRLASIKKHIVLQPPIMATSPSSAIDGTIECCLQALQNNNAVLITTDTELYNKGISSGIDTFKLGDVKKSIENEPEVSFNMNINIQIENDNILTQSADHYEALPLRKNDTGIPVNALDIFKVPATVKNSRNYIEKHKVDIGKPLIFSKSNVVTDVRSSKKEKLIHEGPKDNVTCNKQVGSNIEDDIELLSLHDGQQRSKLSENLQGVSRISGGMNLRKIIINTNIQTNDNKNENSLKTGEAEHRRVIFEGPKINPPNDLGNKPPASSTSEFGIQMKPLTVTVPGKQQNTNSSVKSGPRQKINAYTLEDMLKRFQVKDAGMDQRIESRLDEWVCCFSQILEECLSAVLMNNTQGIINKLPAPWTLLEAVLCLKEVYSNNTAIKTIADKLCSTLSNLSDRNGNLKSKIKSADFMRLFGCGALLMESLKCELPQSAQVLDSEELLNELLHHIREPSTDVDLPFTPMRIVRSEIDYMESMKRNIVPKKPAEIIGYLKIHFPAWKDFDEKLPEDTNTQEIDLQNERTVVRTFGKKLNTVRINNAKKITFDKIPEYNKHELKENFGISVHKELPKIMRTIENIPKDAEHNMKAKCHNDLNKLSNKVSTKCINNGKETVTSYSDWKISADDNDYEELSLERNNFAEDVMIHGDDNAMPFNDDKMETCDAIQTDDEISLFENVNDEIKGDDKENCNDSTNDSGYANQSLDACSFIKLFLSELSASFKLVYTFIEDSIQEFRRNVVELKDKKILHDKANETHLYVADIIGKLKRIIDREANVNTKLKSLIINAGVEALTDKRITRYRQVVMKCLEQAQLLEGALKTMLALTNEHCDITTIDIDNVACHVPYFNIFE